MLIESKGIKPQGGTFVDGTFVEVPRQHNTKEKNEQIKRREMPKSFEANKKRWYVAKYWFCEGKVLDRNQKLVQ